MRALSCLPLVAAIAVIGGTMTACSSAGSASDHSPGPAKSGTANAAVISKTSSSNKGSSGDSGKLIDVCAVLPAAKVSQITGTPFTTVKPSTVAGQITDCEYGGGNNLLQISVATKIGGSLLKDDVNALTQVGHPPTSLSGVGDEAFSEPDPGGNAGAVGASSFASFGAVFGQVYIKIGGLTYVTADQGKQIVGLVHAAM